ncbi:hypothetical protein ACLOJK_011679 [Asimina triloba]
MDGLCLQTRFGVHDASVWVFAVDIQRGSDRSRKSNHEIAWALEEAEASRPLQQKIQPLMTYLGPAASIQTARLMGIVKKE